MGWGGECEVARADNSYSVHVLCTYLTPSPINWALYVPESSRTNPTPDNFVFHTVENDKKKRGVRIFEKFV